MVELKLQIESNTDQETIKKMSLRRAVITGIGAITPAGIGWEHNWKALLAGHSGIRSITLFKTKGYRTTIAGEVRAFPAGKFMPDKIADNSERFVQFAVAATRLALSDSGLRLVEGRRDMGVILGCGMGGLSFFESQAGIFIQKGPGNTRPSAVPRIMPNAAAAQIAALWKIRGPNLTVSTACSSSNHALGQALDFIRAGRCQSVLCGGTESLLSPITFSAFDTLRVMSRRNTTPQKACQPFDKNRDGFVMGEGAVIFVVEELQVARARGAAIYAELAGYGSSNGAYNILAPEPDGAEASESMQAALHDSSISGDEVDYIHAHGTATRDNDDAETSGIKMTFGAHAKNLMISSTKPITGHMLGAAGAMGVMVCALGIKTGRVPPTLNYKTPDPKCDLNYLPGKSRKASIRAALSNAFAFGSNNASILLKRVDNNGKEN
jgi:3-oxoacyl-[acyl-carrier-protein] synthase II